MGSTSEATITRVANYAFGNIYDNYVKKVERKGQSVDDLRLIISWLTGYDAAQIDKARADDSTMAQFFDQTPEFNAHAELIKGVICGVRVEEIDDPFMKKVRQLDKLVDELAKGKKLEKILR